MAVADHNKGVRQEADALVQGVRRTLADIQFYGVKRAEDGVEPIMDEGEREQVKTRYDETKARGQRLAIAIQNVG